MSTKFSASTANNYNNNHHSFGSMSNLKGLLKRRSKYEPTSINEDALEKAFSERDPLDYTLQVDAKVRNINKTFAFPDTVNCLNGNDPERRIKAVKRLVNWLSQKNALNNGQYDTTTLVENATKLFQKLKRYGMKHDFEEETSVLTLLEILSSHPKSALLLISRSIFIMELYNILYNVQAEHQDIAANILHNLTNKGSEYVRLFLKKNKPFPSLVRIFGRPVGTLYYPKNLFLHIENLLEVYPLLGIKHGFFEICFHRIRHKLPEYHMENMKCFTALLRSKKGNELFQESGAMNILLNLIVKRPANINLEYVLKCFDRALNNREMHSLCIPYLDLPLDITEISRRSRNPSVQNTCFSIICKLQSMTSFDNIIRTKCLKFFKKQQLKGTRDVDSDSSDTPAVSAPPLKKQRSRRGSVDIDSTFEMGKLLEFLENASASPDSARLMATKDAFISQLYQILNMQKSKYKARAAQILANLTNVDGVESVQEFAELNKSFAKITNIIKSRKNTPEQFWDHVAHLIKAAPQTALKYELFELITKVIEDEAPNFEKGPAQCLAIFLDSPEAFELFESSDVLDVLLKFISDRKLDPCQFINVLTCLYESLQSEKLVEKILSFEELPKDIVLIAKSSKNPDVQVKAMEIIKKLYTIVPFDKFIHAKCFLILKKIHLEEEFADYERQQFVKFLTSRNSFYRSKSLH